MERKESERLSYIERDYRRKLITDLVAPYKVVVDMVHGGEKSYEQLNMQERGDFAIYFLLIEGFPYEYLD